MAKLLLKPRSFVLLDKFKYTELFDLSLGYTENKTG